MLKNLFQCLKHFDPFHGSGCKEEKMFHQQQESYRFELPLKKSSCLEEHLAWKKSSKNLCFKNKDNLNLHLIFLITFHKTFTFLDYLLQFYF